MDHIDYPDRLFSEEQSESLDKAFRQEMLAQQKRVGVEFLDIDAIELLDQQAGGYVYRLVLSDEIRVHPDQVLTFHIRRPKDMVSAVVMQSDDAGIVVLTDKPLPEDATLIQYSQTDRFHAARSFSRRRSTGFSCVCLITSCTASCQTT